MPGRLDVALAWLVEDAFVEQLLQRMPRCLATQSSELQRTSGVEAWDCFVCLARPACGREALRGRLPTLHHPTHDTPRGCLPQGKGILWMLFCCLLAWCNNSPGVMLSSRTPRRADLKKVTLRPARLCSCSRSGLKCSEV